MKKLIPLIIVACVVFLIGKCTHSIYVGFRDFPEYASVEVMTKKYQTLINDIDSQIEAGSSELSIGSNLESVVYPPNTLYVAIIDNDGEHTIIKGNEISSRSSVIKEGFGYGTLEDVDIVIISRPIHKAELDSVLVYIKYIKPSNE